MQEIASTHTNRRTFLKIGFCGITSAILAHPLLAAAGSEHRVLNLVNLHTGESLATAYRSNGKLIHRAVDRISHLMRDHRTGETMPVDPDLLDQLHRIVNRIKPREPINIISGYRSPRTNEALRKITAGVASDSLHMEGRAIDIRIPGCATKALYRVAVDLSAGGVGYYPRSSFVHLDTGPVRVW